MHYLSLIFFSNSGLPHATVILMTLHTMTNAPVPQQSRSAMYNSTIPVGSKHNYLPVFEVSDFGLLVIWPSQPTCLNVSPVDTWYLLLFHHHLILRSIAQTMSLRPGYHLALNFKMTPSENRIGIPCFALLK